MDRRGRTVLLLALALVATMLVAPAAADPDTSRLQQLQRELRELEAEAAQERDELGELDTEQAALATQREQAQARLRELEAELSLAVDEYNAVVETLEQVQQQRDVTREELAALRAEIDVLEGNVVDHVRRLHKLGPSLEFSAIVGAADPADIGFRSTSLRRIITLDQGGIERLSAGTARAGALEARLADQEREVTELAAAVESELRTVEETYERNAEEMAELEATIDEVESELRTQRGVVSDTEAELTAARRAVAEEEDRLEAARRAERAAQATRTGASSSSTSSGSSSAGNSSSAPAPPPAPAPATRRSADVAVATALAQVGKPYRWGATGPGAYDCSGLTSSAWRAAGVSIPRTSRGQFAGLTRVSRAQLQPGDLLFEYSPVSHVAMYIGNNTIVEASRPGVPVRVTSMSGRSWVGYARP
ncbi:MAG: NlpC/P60 family protein [Nitriliruptoraceae bacterium]